MKRLFPIISCCLLFCIVFSACTENNRKESLTQATKHYEFYDDEDDTLDLLLYNTDTLNPLTTSVKHNTEVLSLLYDSLVTVTADFSYVPNLLKNHSVSKDGLIWYVTIRDGITFQNGKPLTIGDIFASLNTIIASDGYYKKRLSMVQAVKQKGNKIEIHLDKPTENFPVLLDFPILPKNTQRDSGLPVLDTVYAGSGLYKVSGYEINKKIKLTWNENHHSGTVPYIKNIEIHIVPDENTAVTLFENEGVDVLTDSVQALRTYTEKRTMARNFLNSTRFVFLGINLNQKKKASDFLQTLLDNLDRNKMISMLNLSCVPSYLPIHPNSYLTHSVPSQKKKALEMPENLKASLIIAEEDAKARQIAEYIKKEFSGLGASLTIEEVPFKTYVSRIKAGKFDCFLGKAELLPNFVFEKDYTVSGLYFENAVMLYDKTLNAKETKTLNPYLSIPNWSFMR